MEGQDQARLEEITVETVEDDLDHAPKVESGPRRPKKHIRRPGGGGPREELNFTISIDKLEKNSTLGTVNIERTVPEHATLLTVRGGLCARQDSCFDSTVYLLVDFGVTSDLMSMQTAKRARLPLYELTHLGDVVTAGGVQVEVRYYTRAYVRVGEFLNQHHFQVLEIIPDLVLGSPWLRSYNLTVGWKERYAVPTRA